MSFLITSSALSLWSISKSLQFEVKSAAKAHLFMPQNVGVSYPCEPLSRLPESLILTTGRPDESHSPLEYALSFQWPSI